MVYIVLSETPTCLSQSLSRVQIFKNVVWQMTSQRQMSTWLAWFLHFRWNSVLWIRKYGQFTAFPPPRYRALGREFLPNYGLSCVKCQYLLYYFYTCYISTPCSINWLAFFFFFFFQINSQLNGETWVYLHSKRREIENKVMNHSMFENEKSRVDWKWV